ncbi:hypothetical protein L3X38_029035 [Prunus dulcis]|uniref:Uncharacterized protein n=1 Tax=Prunus dulcis TaxID=3755 RepID=A0AAD4VS87_PRUDU|nr:hypothetical protein L3X38_029035 [Prunus dulcis]
MVSLQIFLVVPCLGSRISTRKILAFAYVMNHSVTETNTFEQHPQEKKVEKLLKRPGNLFAFSSQEQGIVCLNLIANITIQKNQTAVSPSCALSAKGLPLRTAPEYLPEKSMSAPPPFVMNHSVTETNSYEQHPQRKARTFAHNTVPMAFAILGQLVNLTIRRYQLPFCYPATTNGAGNIWK